MATLESNDSNILDAETINWRLVVYPIVAAVILLLGGFGYYYYLQSQRELLETQARAVLLQARTPEEFVKVADAFPKTDQATIALLSAAEGSFIKRDFAAAMADYQRIVGAAADPELRDSAQLGLARSLEASGKPDDAVGAARREDSLRALRLRCRGVYLRAAGRQGEPAQNPDRGGKPARRFAVCEAGATQAEGTGSVRSVPKHARVRQLGNEAR